MECFFCLFEFHKLLEEGQCLIDHSLPSKHGCPNIARILKTFTGISIMHKIISFFWVNNYILAVA